MSSNEISQELEEKKTKKTLPIVFLTVFIDLLGFSIVLPILAPLLALPFGSSILPNTPYDQRLVIFGFLVASYAIAQFFATPIIGQLSDRYGRKPLLAISLVGTFLSRLMFIYGILQGNITILFISRIIDGITGGNISVAQSAIADVSTPKNRAKNFGLIGAAFGIGFVLGPYIGGRLGDIALVNSVNTFFNTSLFTSSTLPLWFATLLCGINIILMLRIFPETLKEKIHKTLSFTTSMKNVVKAFTMGNLRTIFISVFLLFLGFGFFTQFLSVYIGTKFQPEALEAVKQKFTNGEIKVDLPSPALQQIPASQREQARQSFITQTDNLFSTITSEDLSTSVVKYPNQIEQIPDQQAKASAEQSYLSSIKFINGLVEAETQKRSSDAFSYVGVWIAISQAIIAGQLSKKFKSITLFKSGLLILAVTIFVLLLPDKIIWLFVILPFIAIGNGLSQPSSMAIISNSADAKSQGEVLGLNASIQSLSQALPSLVSGYLAGKLSLSAPILVGGGFVVAALAVMLFFYKDRAKDVFHES